MSRSKLLLATGVALTTLSSAALAQSNTVYLNQQDNGSTATVTQSGSGNTAGTSASRLNQQGTVNVQYGIIGTGGHTLTVTQSGTNGNVGHVDAGGYVSSTTASTQAGTGNALTVNQGGDGNQVAYLQYGNNPATLPSAVSAPSGYDPVFNSSTGWNTINQNNGTTGSGNKVSVRQGYDTHRTDNAGFIINQTGSTNSAWLYQESNSLVSMRQDGTGGQISLAQSYGAQTTGGFANNYNLADIRQTGAGGDAYADQRGANQRLLVTQDGNNHFFDRQNGYASSINVDQKGSGSDVHLFQGATVPSSELAFSPPYARGCCGLDYTDINPGGPNSTINSSISVAQNAINGRIVFVQNGDTQTATLIQLGANNQMYGMQSGSMDTANLTQQGGAGNIMFVSQTGTNQTSNVTQGPASNNFTSSLQSGMSNQLAVRQNRS